MKEGKGSREGTAAGQNLLQDSRKAWRNNAPPYSLLQLALGLAPDAEADGLEPLLHEVVHRPGWEDGGRRRA